MQQFLDRYFKQLFLALYLVTDYLAIAGSFLLAFGVRKNADVVSSLDLEIVNVPDLAFDYADFIRIVPMVALLWVSIFALNKLYKNSGKKRGIEEFVAVFQSSSLGVLSMMMVGFFLGRQPFSRLITLYAWIISIILITFGRLIIHLLENLAWKNQIGVERTLFCHVGHLGKPFLEGIRQQGWPGVYVVGVLDDSKSGLFSVVRKLTSGPIIQDGSNTVSGFPYLGHFDQLDNYLSTHKVDTAILGLGKLPEAAIYEMVKICQQHNADVLLIPNTLSLSSTYKVRETINGIPLMGPNRFPISGTGAIVKRLTDILLTGIALIVLSPLMLFLALLIKLSSPGPIIYKQSRTGKNNHALPTYKFRTMHHLAEDQTGKKWTTEDDQRRTRVGAFLRKSNLDELPQLWNILVGDMSIVGPRPEQPKFVEEFAREIPRYQERHQVRPGLTGWAQVNGWRGNTSIEERLQYDLFYIENWSLLFDFKIMLQTVKSFFNAKGAY